MSLPRNKGLVSHVNCGRIRWFHPNVSGQEAEVMLMEQGIEGSFLVHPPRSSPGDLTLSVRQNGIVKHIKIHNIGDFYFLKSGDKFATLPELVRYYLENQGQLRAKGGEIIQLKFPLNCDNPTTERWFHGHLSGCDAEAMVMQNRKSGSFLVRESQSKHGDYVLSVRTDDKVTHVKIIRVGGKYNVEGGRNFDTLSELVAFYQLNPMVDESGSVVFLKTAVNATRINTQDIDERIQELSSGDQKGHQRSTIGDVGFWEEFESLQQQSGIHLYSRKVGRRPENTNKNRYANILPFDHTRVILRGREAGIPGSDYINASMIASEEDLGIKAKSYIATQGCLPSTAEDFWWMVWQENTKVIVMLTKDMEKGKKKCFRYWPEESSTRVYGNIALENLCENSTRDYILREFLVRKDNQAERKIFHYQFTAWPDHSVPSDPGSLLNFLHVVNQRQGDVASSAPITVHCSAGIGRTGTLIIIDMILQQIDRQGLDCQIDIHRTTQVARAQRAGMVQAQAQYKLVYMAVKQHIETLQQRRIEKMKNHLCRDYTNIK